MDLVLVESPYAGDVDRNLAYLREALADCFARGEAPFASHGLYTQPGILDDAIPEERAKGIEAGLLWGAHAKSLVFYVNFGFSRGMIQGLERARSEGRRCIFRIGIPDVYPTIFVEISEVEALAYDAKLKTEGVRK